MIQYNKDLAKKKQVSFMPEDRNSKKFLKPLKIIHHIKGLLPQTTVINKNIEKKLNKIQRKTAKAL